MVSDASSQGYMKHIIHNIICKLVLAPGTVARVPTSDKQPAENGEIGLAGSEQRIK